MQCPRLGRIACRWVAGESGPIPERPVLVVLHGESMGGATLSVLRLIPALQERGWRFVFWAPRPGEVFDAVTAAGREVHGEPRGLIGYSWKALRVPPGPVVRLGRLPRYFGALRRLIRETDPALVHANSLYTLAEAGLARAHGVPTVLHVHEMVRSNRKGRIARALAGRAGTVVAGVSNAGAAALSTPRRPAKVVYECVPIPAEVPHRKPGSRTTVGTIGVIAARKGTDTFVEAARRVLAETDEVAFRIVGRPDDPLDHEWAKRVLAELPGLGIEHAERVSVDAELAKLDVFVLPSRIDPFPIVVLEAMASGLPVIGTRVDGIAEQIDSESGLLVDVEDAEGLASAILELHGDRALRQRLGEGARGRVEANFSLDRQVDELESCYLEAMASAGRGSSAAS